MAVLHHKEEKIQAVLGRLAKKYTDEEFVAMFIKLYSKDWGKIKSAYIKASQDKEPGTIINMPKPDLYLKQILSTFLQQSKEAKIIAVNEEVKEAESAAVVKKIKAVTKKEEVPKIETSVKVKKVKVAVKK